MRSDALQHGDVTSLHPMYKILSNLQA